MKKRIIKKDKKYSLISRMLGVVLFVALLCIPKSIALADEEKTYALRVATGLADGSCIGFFGIEYKDENGKLQLQYIFPHDASYEYKHSVEQTSEDGRREQVSQMGYYYESWDNARSKTVMGVYSEDLFFFEVDEHEIVSVESIYIYTDIAAGTNSNWTCTALEVYQIDKFYGSGVYGYVSDEQYMNFSGKILASLQKTPQDFGTATDKVHEVSKDSSYKLNTTIRDYTVDSASASSEYIFKLDIADVYGAGVETFANSKGKKMRDMSYAETLNLEIAYQDKDGVNKVVNVPVITSAYANAARNTSVQTRLVDFAGQGESLAIPVNLPYFEKLVSTKLTYGPNEALKASGMKERTITEEREKQKNKIISSGDTISLTGISMYKAGENASKLTYEVQDGTILVPKITGEPLFYYTADSYRGIEIGIGRTTTINMLPYEEGVRLQPEDKQTKYLIAIDTDSVSTSVSRTVIPNITMQLTYTNTSGISVETEAYSLKDLAKEYYGYLSNKAGDDCAYAMNVSSGQRLFVVVPLSGVEQFTSVSFYLQNNFEEWQMSGFSIYKIDELSKRHAEWFDEDKTFYEQSVSYSYYRELNGVKERVTQSALMYNAQLNILFQNVRKQTIDFASLKVAEGVKNYDWLSVDKYKLDYTKADAKYLGFYDTMMDYQVDVKVADNSTNTLEDGDSGSKNYFYFQLVFEDGTSSIVQANQLLEADGFLTGQTASFNISANYDYGNLIAIRVIPDDFTENADPYDKLNIEYINVTKKEKSGFATVWSVKDIGWVGIDYKDDAQETDPQVKTGRTMEELAYTYNVTNSSAGIEIQFALTTGSFDPSANGKPFVGSITADIGYIDTNGGYKTINFDVVQAMYNYANKTAGINSKNGKRQSDSSFMFLENRTNRFSYFMSDVSELVDICLYVYSDGGGKLNISSVSAALVVQEGPLAINTWGEYEKKSELFPLTRNANPISIFEMGMEGQVYNKISFIKAETGMLTGLLQGTWPYEVNREITITEDYLNINVYPKTALSDVPNLTMQAIIDYSDSYGKTYRVQEEVDLKTSSTGAFYYGVDKVRASDLSTIKGVKIEKVSGSGDMEVGQVIVQKVREGQILQTSVYDLAGMKVSTAPTSSTTQELTETGEFQKVSLAFAENMDRLDLQTGVRDVAVAIRYTSLYDPNGEEYISPYVYLSNSQINSILGGQIVDFEFSIKNIDHITGISVAATGGLAIETANAVVASYQTSAGVMKLKEWYSVREGGVIANESKNFVATTSSASDVNTLIPINMEVTTGVVSGQNTGTNAGIRMTIAYNGFDGNYYTTEIADLRKYTISGGYTTVESAKVQLLLPNIKEIVSMSFEPYDENPGVMEAWKLGNITLSYGVESDVKSASIALTEQQGFAYEGTPTSVSIKKIFVDMECKLPSGVIEKEDMKDGCWMLFDETMNIKVSVQNSTLGANVTVYELLNGVRRDVTSLYLTKVAETGEWTFKVPATATSETASFEIVAVSQELSESKTSIMVAVKKEAEVIQETETSTEGSTEASTESGN